GVAAATVLAGSYAIAGAAARVAGAGGAPEVIRGLRELRSMTIDFAAIPLAVFLTAAALVILQTRVAPRWLGWLGLAAALPNLAGVGAIYSGSGALEQVGYLGLGFVLLALW